MGIVSRSKFFITYIGMYFPSPSPPLSRRLSPSLQGNWGFYWCAQCLILDCPAFSSPYLASLMLFRPLHQGCHGLHCQAKSHIHRQGGNIILSQYQSARDQQAMHQILILLDWHSTLSVILIQVSYTNIEHLSDEFCWLVVTQISGLRSGCRWKTHIWGPGAWRLCSDWSEIQRSV